MTSAPSPGKQTGPRQRISLPQKAALAMGGLLFALAVLEVSLRGFGLLVLRAQDRANRAAAANRNAYRVLCLGESTTQNQYPPFLEQELNRLGGGIKFSVIDRGLAGTNTRRILAGLEADLDKYRPDLVVAMMGVNDYGKHIPYPTEFKSGGERLLKSLRTYKLISLLLAGAGAELDASQGRRRPAALLAGESARMKTAWRLMAGGDYSRAEPELLKAAEEEPANEQPHLALGWLYTSSKRPKQAELAFKKAAAIAPENEDPYVELGWLYDRQGNRAATEQLFLEAVKRNPASARLNAGLAAAYSDSGKMELFAAQARRVAELNAAGYNPETAANYRALELALKARKIRLVCVQYPLRDATGLKAIFGHRDEPPVFVDNGPSFREAVRQKGYGAYFTDRFAGDFGHCTESGNRLLAGNIAKAILKEVFGL